VLLRPRWPILLLVLTLLCATDARGQVHAAAEARIQLLNKKAMEEYDSLEFEAAKAALVEALGVARSASVTRGAALTNTYLDLGVVYGAGLNDRINAIKYFTAALRINRGAKLNPGRATPGLDEMFAAAAQTVASEPVRPSRPPFAHDAVDEATAGQDVPIQVRVEDEAVQRVVVFYRTTGSLDFRQVLLREARPGLYTGSIPGNQIQGRSIHYFVEAQNTAGQRLHGQGTAQSPTIISVTPGRNSLPKPPLPRSSGRKVFSIGIMVGIGLGIVNGGKSEHDQQQVAGNPRQVDINPGAALAPFHIAPELTYHLSDSWHLSVLSRIQVINAIDEASKVSLLGEVRAKRFFGQGDLRFYMAFGAGAGQIRHRIPLGDYDKDAGIHTPDDRVDSRVAGIGAFGLGSGMIYMFSSYVGLELELNGLIMVPDFAANLDVNTGLVLSF